MVKVTLSNFIFLFFLIGCANNYKLENKSILNIDKSYYSPWFSGAKGGGSGFNVHLVLYPSNSLDINRVKIEGVYFKKKYTKLKYQGLNKYQAFIKNDNDLDKLEIDNNKKVKTSEIKMEKFPFALKEDEAVIRYLIKNKQKYLKIKIIKKKSIDFPM